jgi:hypothetical protein
MRTTTTSKTTGSDDDDDDGALYAYIYAFILVVRAIIHWHTSTKRAMIIFFSHRATTAITFTKHGRECVAASGEPLDDSFLIYFSCTKYGLLIIIL